MNESHQKVGNSLPKVRKRWMSKFQVLRYNQEFMTEIKIYSCRLTNPNVDFFRSKMSYFVLSLSSIAIISSAVFVYIDSSDLKATLDSVFLIITSLQTIAVWINIGLQMANFKDFLNQLQGIVDKGDTFFFKSYY